MALWQFYQELNGQTPSKATIVQLSNNLGLKVSQVYKWFWDMNKKVDNCTEQLVQDNEQSEFPAKNPTPKGLDPKVCAAAFPNMPDLENIKPDEFELLAIEVGINIEQLAQDIIECDSPKNTR